LIGRIRTATPVGASFPLDDRSEVAILTAFRVECNPLRGNPGRARINLPENMPRSGWTTCPAASHWTYTHPGLDSGAIAWNGGPIWIGLL